MTSIKCPQCGFVSSRTNANCKRCGVALTASTSGPPFYSGLGGKKVLIIGAAAAITLVIVVAGLTVWSQLSAFAGRNPSSSQLATLLQSCDAVKRSVNEGLMSELTGTFIRDDLSEDRFLQNFPEINVLKQLDLATVDNFQVVKADHPECRKYDWDYNQPVPEANYPHYYGDQYKRIYREDGANSDCTNVWHYSVSVTVVDPESVDRTALDTRLHYLNTAVSPPLEALPISEQVVFMRSGNANFRDVPIGTIELVAVSDLVAGATPNACTLGFKYRFKPNALGDVFELALHKSEPAAIRKMIESPASDDRLRNVAKANDNEGLGTGYAELLKEGSSGTWKISAVYFQDRPDSRYKFHQL